MNALLKGKKHKKTSGERFFFRPWSDGANTIWINRADEQSLHDKAGNTYFDLTSGSFNVSLGYSQTLIKRAISNQLNSIAYVHPMFANDIRERLCEALIDSTNHAFEKAYICSGGSEAVEAAMRFAIHFTKRHRFLHLDKAFHGVTPFSFTDIPTENNHIIAKVPTPYCHRCPFGADIGKCCFQCVGALKRTIEESKGTLAALFLEPIIGINGVIIPPKKYLHEARRLTKKHKILLIYDEVLTGCGRTGKMFAFQHTGITPDMICLGKGLNSGYLPVGATLVSREIAKEFANRPLAYGATNLGHPVVCASALAGLKIINRKCFLESIVKKGKALKNISLALKKNHPDLVSDVRGEGLLVGLELMYGANHRPLRESEIAYFAGLLAQVGILADLDTTSSVLLIAPPLTVCKHELHIAIKRISDCLHKFRIWKQLGESR